MAYDADESLRRNRNRSWWKQRTKMEQNGLVLLIIAALLILGLIIGICVVSNKNRDQDASVDKEWNTANVDKNSIQIPFKCQQYYQIKKLDAFLSGSVTETWGIRALVTFSEPFHAMYLNK